PHTIHPSAKPEDWMRRGRVFACGCNGPGSSWFEVGFGGQASQAAPEEAAIIDRMNRAMEQQQRRFEMEDKEKIKAADARMDANAWLEHVGWATHLEGFDPEAMLQLTDPDSLIRVMSQARAIATPAQVGSQALFEAQRKEVDKKPRRPFDNRMEDDTWARYTAVWTKLTVMALLDHRLAAGEYRSAIISGLAVMGIRKDGGWMDVLDYTPIYSAVIKIARAMVVYQSYVERQAEVARLKQVKMDEQQREDGSLDEREAQEEAEEEATSMFRIVRKKVQRFMTVTSGNARAEPTPMDWIYEVRTYGMHIRFNTPAGGTIDWVGDRIKHRRVQFRMGELTETLHSLKDEARGLITTLAMVDDVSQLPQIPWSSFEDDHGEDRVGYSFLEDDRNPRATEILSIRHKNTMNGGVRNIFAHNGLMCFVTSYHESFRATGQA
ncbi:hypothetical protein DER44DRAFT_636665, partial [Fusarium oxysporum]